MLINLGCELFQQWDEPCVNLTGCGFVHSYAGLSAEWTSTVKVWHVTTGWVNNREGDRFESLGKFDRVVTLRTGMKLHQKYFLMQVSWVTICPHWIFTMSFLKHVRWSSNAMSNIEDKYYCKGERTPGGTTLDVQRIS